MKKLFILLTIAAIVLSCKSTDEPTVKKPFVIDPLATINLKPAAGTVLKVKGENEPIHMTAKEIVKNASCIWFNDLEGDVNTRGFDPLQRDTVSATPMLKMWATDIIQSEYKFDGTPTGVLYLEQGFLTAKNCLLIRFLTPDQTKQDTIAYIPNRVLRDAEAKIRPLFEVKDYEAIYKLFNDAYTFIPITGAEYRELVKTGNN